MGDGLVALAVPPITGLSANFRLQTSGPRALLSQESARSCRRPHLCHLLLHILRPHLRRHRHHLQAEIAVLEHHLVLLPLVAMQTHIAMPVRAIALAIVMATGVNRLLDSAILFSCQLRWSVARLEPKGLSSCFFSFLQSQVCKCLFLGAVSRVLATVA